MHECLQTVQSRADLEQVAPDPEREPGLASPREVSSSEPQTAVRKQQHFDVYSRSALSIMPTSRGSFHLINVVSHLAL